MQVGCRTDPARTNGKPSAGSRTTRTATLDALPLDVAARSRVVEEAARAFHLNRALADELWSEYAE